eukprot:751829-Hanusia_phi.AAC.1
MRVVFTKQPEFATLCLCLTTSGKAREFGTVCFDQGQGGAPKVSPIPVVLGRRSCGQMGAVWGSLVKLLVVKQLDQGSIYIWNQIGGRVTDPGPGGPGTGASLTLAKKRDSLNRDSGNLLGTWPETGFGTVQQDPTCGTLRPRADPMIGSDGPTLFPGSSEATSTEPVTTVPSSIWHDRTQTVPCVTVENSLSEAGSPLTPPGRSVTPVRSVTVRVTQSRPARGRVASLSGMTQRDCRLLGPPRAGRPGRAQALLEAKP